MNPKQIEIVDEEVATAHLLLAAMILHSQMEDIGPARLFHDSSVWSSQWEVYMFICPSLFGTLRFAHTVSCSQLIMFPKAIQSV